MDTTKSASQLVPSAIGSVGNLQQPLIDTPLRYISYGFLLRLSILTGSLCPFTPFYVQILMAAYPGFFSGVSTYQYST